MLSVISTETVVVVVAVVTVVVVVVVVVAVVVAVGSGSNPLISATTPDLAVDRKGHIVADPETMATSIPGVFAGGDIVLGAATVILAMGEGRKAAAGIASYLASKGA